LSKHHTCIPDADALTELQSAWSWLLPTEHKLLIVSAFGDVFYADNNDDVFWLNTGTAEIEKVANSTAEFQSKLDEEEGFEWLMPDLVEALESEGKILAPGQCYTYAILPIFDEGEFETWNFKPVSARAHFGLTAHIHRQIAGLADGSQVKISHEP
jgi:Domain of unknown function (DUF1851)